MTLNATSDISIQSSSICCLNDETSNLNNKLLSINDQVENNLSNDHNLDLNLISKIETIKDEPQDDLQMETKNVSNTCSINNNQSTNEEDSSIQKSIDSVLEESSIQESINSVLEENDKIINKPKKKDNQSDSPKKRIKLISKKEEITCSSKSSPLIRQAKLQINDKTLKKLRSDTDDLVFEEDLTNANSDPKQSLQSNDESKLKNNNLLIPVVNNVLSRSIAAIFRNSTISKNGEFNSYSALGFNKGPRVKRVCRTFSDVYRGLPRAVFPLPSNSNSSNKINKSSSSSNNSPNKKSKSKKIKNSKSTYSSQQSSASTSKSNSNSSFKEDDSTEYCSPYDSDDLEINEYIERNLKRELETKEF